MDRRPSLPLYTPNAKQRSKTILGVAGLPLAVDSDFYQLSYLSTLFHNNLLKTRTHAPTRTHARTNAHTHTVVTVKLRNKLNINIKWTNKIFGINVSTQKHCYLDVLNILLHYTSEKGP